MQKEFHYRNILLTPRFSELNSRSEASTKVKFGEMQFNLPVVPSNMKTVIDQSLASWLAKNGYFYVMHRFDVDQVAFCKDMRRAGYFTSISTGVNQDSYAALYALKREGITPDYITIDIAHGHSIKMRSALQFIKFTHPGSFVIAGNTCTKEGVESLESWGADAVKVGIGPGSVCTTRLQTGFSRPQFTTVLECASIAKKPVIADGGIEHNGDIAKALVAGATLVMAGHMFAGYEESPGNTLNADSGTFKEYYGSASEHNKAEKMHIEGKKTLIPYRGPIKHKFDELEQSLRSSISYAGGKDLSAFLRVKWTICE